MNTANPAYTERRASAHPTMAGTQHHHSAHQQHQQQHQQQLTSNTHSNTAAANTPQLPAGIPFSSPAAVAYYAAHPRRQQVYFGNYLLLQTLGEGEFGKVKLGVHRDWGEEVAVKLIKRDKVAGGGPEQGPIRLDAPNKDPAKMTKVEREIQVLKDICHPNIVRLFEVIESDRYIGIVLEYASGGELFDHILAHKYLKEKDACRLFAQLISGVSYLHQKKIIHRDLKLENLLLDRNRNVIITDFGFANNFEDKRDDLMATSCGSPCYAAPELVVQDGLYAGSAVDVWSCGVILYAMLAGYLPFDDDPQNPDGDNINLLYKYIMATPLTFPDYITEQPRDLLCKMLVPDPLLRATLPMVMAHPWLHPYVELFKFSVDELERAAKEQQTRKRQAYHQQMLAQEKIRAQQSMAMGRSQTAADGLLLGSAGSSAVSGSASSNGLPLDTRQQRHQSAMATTSTVPDRLNQEAGGGGGGHKAAGTVSGAVPSAGNQQGARTAQRPTTAMPMPTAAPSPFGATPASYQRPNMEIVAGDSPASTAATAGWHKTTSPAPVHAPLVAAEEAAAAAAKQPAGSKHQRHTIQLEYDSRTSPDAKRTASSRQHSNDVIPPVPKVPRVDSVPSPSGGRKPSGSAGASPSVNPGAGMMSGGGMGMGAPFVLEGKTTIVPEAEKQIQAELNRTPKRNEGSTSSPSPAASAVRSRSASGSGGGNVPSPVNEVKTPPTASLASLAMVEETKTPVQKVPAGGVFASSAAAEGLTTPTAGSIAPAQAKSNEPAAVNGVSSSPASRSTSSYAAVGSMVSPPSPATNNADANGAARGANGRPARPQTAMPTVSGSMLADSSMASASVISSGTTTSSPPKSSESRAARHRKGLSTDKFFFSRLLGNNSPSSASASATTANESVVTPSPQQQQQQQQGADGGEDTLGSIPMGPPSSTDVRRGNGGSGGRRKALSLVVGAGGRGNDPSPAARDRERAKLVAAQKEKENLKSGGGKEERRLTARFGRKDSVSTQGQGPQPPSTPKGQYASLPVGVSPSPGGLTTPSVKGSIAGAGSTNGSFRSPGFFDPNGNGDSSSVGPSSNAAKKVMDWFRKKSLSKGTFTEMPPFDLDRSSLASTGTPSRVGPLGDTLGNGSAVLSGEDGTPRLVVTGAERSSDPEKQLDSVPSSRSTSGTHSQGTQYTSLTAATTVSEGMIGGVPQKVPAAAAATHDDDDANTAMPRASPSVAQGGAGASQLSLMRPFTDTVLREHLGAVDQSALTSRLPPQVFAEVRKALYEMGIEVRKERDEEFKLECVRRKKNKTLLGTTQGLGLSIRSSVFRPSEAEMERSAAKASAGISASAGGGGGGAEPGSSGIRNFLRRGTITASSPPMKNHASLTSSSTIGLVGQGTTTGAPAGTDDPNALPPPIYGEGHVDGGQEVRFSVEITRIKNLSGLYSLDIRRMKGNLWAYKFIYHALLDRCQLASNGLA
ncbi:unnamed protein product [Tilletia controversa]|nr:unnamed protein product [Tilletia controversa]